MRKIKVDMFELMDELHKKRFGKELIAEIIKILLSIEEN